MQDESFDGSFRREKHSQGAVKYFNGSLELLPFACSRVHTYRLSSNKRLMSCLTRYNDVREWLEIMS